MTVKGNSSKQLQPAKQVTYARCFLSKMTSWAWMQCVCMKSPCARVHPCKEGTAGSREVPYIKHLGGMHDLCHMPTGVTSNTYCNRKHSTFTVISTLAYILLLRAVQGISSDSLQ